MLSWLKYQVKRKSARDNPRGKATIGQPDEAPVLDANIGIPNFCLRDAKTTARRALIMEKFTNRSIRHRRVGKKDLLRRKFAGVARVNTRTGAKESDLETQILAFCGFDRSCDIPPFSAKIGVRTVICWEDKSAAGCDVWVSDARRLCDTDRGERAERQTE